MRFEQQRTCSSLFATAAVVALLSATAGQAWADEVKPNLIEEVVVTAQHRSENIQDVPIAIQAFTAKSIQDLGVKSTADLSQFTPNVQITGGLGAASQPIITIRGIGMNDFNTNNSGPNGVYVDEFYVSAPSAQSFSFFDLERVEVLKGPQGTLYGRNTSGGAINLVTAKPTDALSAHAHLSYSSWNTFNVEGAIGGPITSTLSGRFAAVVNKSDGYMHNLLYDTRENGANNISARAQLLWKPNDDLKILFNLHGGYVDNRPDQYGHYGTLDPTTFDKCSVADIFARKCVDIFGYSGPSGRYEGMWDRRDHLRSTDLGSSLRVDYALPHNLDFVSITGWNYNHKHHPETSDAGPNRNLKVDYNAQSAEVTQEFRLSQAGDRYNWVAGAYYLHEGLKQNQPLYILLDLDKFFGPGAGDGAAEIIQTVNRQVTSSEAIFGQGDYKLTDQLKLTLGARYTHERKSFRSYSYANFQEGGMDHFGPKVSEVLDQNSLSESKFNWRIGLDYSFTPGAMAFATVSTGFKSGGFNGGFLDSDPVLRARELEPVKPETVTAYEVGLKSTLFDHRVIFNASVFYYDYRNQQVFNLINENGALLNVLDNAEKAETYGLDAELQAYATRELSFTAQLGLLHAEMVKFVANRDPAAPDYSGNTLPLAPKVSATLGVNWKHPLSSGTLEAQLNANYRSRQYFDAANSPLVSQAGYWLGNARLSYTTADDRWELAAFARNIGGQYYTTYSGDLTNPFGVLTPVIGPPRSVGIELDYRF